MKQNNLLILAIGLAGAALGSAAVLPRDNDALSAPSGSIFGKRATTGSTQVVGSSGSGGGSGGGGGGGAVAQNDSDETYYATQEAAQAFVATLPPRLKRKAVVEYVAPGQWRVIYE